MKKIGLILLGFHFLCLGVPAWAAQVAGLYESSVEVAGRGEEERRVALREALQVVLIKVTGFGAVAEEPPGQAMLEDAEKFVQQFRYHVTEPQEEGEKPVQRLAVQFDRNAIEAVVRKQGLPLWGQARPTTLAWIAVEEGHRHRLLGATDVDPLRFAAERTAERRGLPLRLPLMDLQDQASVRVADVWGGFHEAILEASRRYDSQAVLMGRIYQDRGVWHSSWTLFQGEEVLRWDSEGFDAELVLSAGIEGATDHLSVRFAQIFEDGGKQHMDLQVAGVADLAGYARAMKYLRSVAGVSAVDVLRVSPESLECRLSIDVDAANVAKIIALGSMLVPDEGAVAATGPSPASPAFRYRYVR